MAISMATGSTSGAIGSTSSIGSLSVVASVGNVAIYCQYIIDISGVGLSQHNIGIQ